MKPLLWGWDVLTACHHVYKEINVFDFIRSVWIHGCRDHWDTLHRWSFRPGGRPTPACFLKSFGRLTENCHATLVCTGLTIDHIVHSWDLAWGVFAHCLNCGPQRWWTSPILWEELRAVEVLWYMTPVIKQRQPENLWPFGSKSSFHNMEFEVCSSVFFLFRLGLKLLEMFQSVKLHSSC